MKMYGITKLAFRENIQQCIYLKTDAMNVCACEGKVREKKLRNDKLSLSESTHGIFLTKTEAFRNFL